MTLAKASFENLDEARKTVDSTVFEKAVGTTIRQLSDQAATQISKAARERYPVKAGTIRSALRKEYAGNSQVPQRLLIYASSRLSMRHFATKARPIIKTPAGVRIGVKVKDSKLRPIRLLPGGFRGQALNGGGEQIFSRKKGEINPQTRKEKLKKETGPSISQMVRGTDVLDRLNDFIALKADTLLQTNLEHFQKKKIGVR